MGAASGWWVSNLAPAGSVVPVLVLPVASPLFALGLRIVLRKTRRGPAAIGASFVGRNPAEGGVTPSGPLERILAAMKDASTPLLDTWLRLMQTRSVMAATKLLALLRDGHGRGQAAPAPAGDRACAKTGP